jgi:nicotinic acid mononucleotide adenylyltransferase
MCQLATNSSSWIRADNWECRQKQWNFTLSILQHHRAELQKKYNNNVRLMLLCGADLVDSFTRIKPNGKYLNLLRK